MYKRQPRTPGRGIFANRIIQNATLVLLVIPQSYMAVYAVSSGIPALLSLQEGGMYDRIQVSVIDQGRKSKKRACDYRAKINWDGGERTICNLPPHIWGGLLPGQTLELAGWQTDYGFRYEAFKRLP